MVPLSLKELEKCIQYSLENSGRYLDDALLLYNEKRYASSILLSHLSMHAHMRTNRRDYGSGGVIAVTLAMFPPPVLCT